MTKAKATARKSVKRGAGRSPRSQGAAMPRSLQHRGTGDTRKAVQAPRHGRRLRGAAAEARAVRGLATKLLA